MSIKTSTRTRMGGYVNTCACFHIQLNKKDITILIIPIFNQYEDSPSKRKRAWKIPTKINLFTIRNCKLIVFLLFN